MELRGADEGGAAPTLWVFPPASWLPRGVPDFDSKSEDLGADDKPQGHAPCLVAYSNTP